MRILIISAVFPPEPIVSAKLSMDLYRTLKEKGHSVKVIHPIPSRPYGFKPNMLDIGLLGDDEIIVDSYVCPQSSLFGRIRESLSFGKASSIYIKEHYKNIDCIYANVWPLFSQLAIVNVANKLKIPCIVHIQDVYPESLANKMSGIVKKTINTIFLPIDKIILRKCTKVVAISEKMKSYLVNTRGLFDEKVTVVINWQDEKDFTYYKKCRDNKDEKFTFMYMGNIGPVAGVDLLLDAFLVANITNARLVIAGSGSMKEKLMKKAASAHNIEFWEVPNGKVPEIQSKADCMLLPIKKGAASSSIPSKLPAYMFSAKPIIGCVDEDSDTANAINEAKCGWVIEPENPEKLAETMKKVTAMDKKDLDKKAKNSLQYGLTHFSKKENLSKLLSVIEEIL